MLRHAQQQLMAPRGVAHGARIEVELVGDAVAHEHAALVVEDLAARRAHDDLLLVVARRLRHERARVEHLQRPQAQHEQHEQHDDRDAQRAQPEPQAPVRARRPRSDQAVAATSVSGTGRAAGTAGAAAP